MRGAVNIEVPTIIGPEDRQRFTYGQCGALAAVMAELTGLDVYSGIDRRSGTVNHVVVEIEPGRLWGDVYGIGTVEQHRACNGSYRFERLASADEAREAVTDMWNRRAVDWPRAEAIAPLVLRLWQGDESAGHIFWPRTAEEVAILACPRS